MNFFYFVEIMTIFVEIGKVIYLKNIPTFAGF